MQRSQASRNVKMRTLRRVAAKCGTDVESVRVMVYKRNDREQFGRRRLSAGALAGVAKRQRIEALDE